MHRYVVETFDTDEVELLRRHVTNLDQPVFALVELPEVVKGALFARYSRSHKSLRRLMVDEFAGDLSGLPRAERRSEDPTGRAASLYRRVFGEYGDDSVAQLGGAHAAVEHASNLLTKQLEWGRLAAYLEQSTRYIAYDDRPDGRYRYYRDPDVMASSHAASYERTLDAVFDTYASALPRVLAWAEDRFPRAEHTSPAAHRRALTAKACDLLRGLLPAATVSNVGIFASGQAYEQMLLRLRSSPLAEARATGDRLLAELRHVIPSFLERVDRPDRGEVWSAYLADTRSATRSVTRRLLEGIEPQRAPEVSLVAWSPDAERDLLVGILYPHADLGERQLVEVVEGLSTEQRERLVRAYTGDRSNRRHKPGRALERVWYRFDVCSDYGAFRDLQRHRLLTIEWQELGCRHGYETPEELARAGVEDDWHRALDSQARLWQALRDDLPEQAQYAVGFAWRLRYSMQLNARAAMQMLELRTQPQGHASYRRVCQQMHTLIADVAGHHGVAAMMRFVDHSAGELERLAAEERVEQRRRAARTLS
ncbi:MAG: FAD-dependent thymidylate synthase [Egibacteraceae bacterium]